MTDIGWGLGGGVSHNAQIPRQATAALCGDRQGVVGTGHLLVVQTPTPSMGVAVQSGYALIRGSSIVQQGVYSWRCPSGTLSISPGDPTNPRNDIVGVQVQEDFYDSSGQNRVRLLVVEGTPAAGPSDPSLPASFLPLARVRVDANESTSIVNADITDLRQRAGDAWLDTRVTTLESGPGVDQFNDPTLHSSFTGTFRVHRVGRMVWLVVNVTYSGAGVSNTSVTLGSAPVGYRPTATHACSAVLSTNAGFRATINAANGNITIPSLTISDTNVLSISTSWVAVL